MSLPAKFSALLVLFAGLGFLYQAGDDLAGSTQSISSEASTSACAACPSANGAACQAAEMTTFVSLPVEPQTTAADSASTTAESNVDPRDWPYWRGPDYNGISYETGLIDDWDPYGGEGSNVAWKREDLGTRSTPIVMNGKLYVLCRAEPRTKREGEKVVCLDAATGDTLWENRFNVWLSDVPAERVGWSAVVGDPQTGNVYALGVCGYFQCINGETGETIWSYPLHEQFGLLSTYGGRTNFPVVCDDMVIISAIVIGWGELAKPAHRFLAFDKHTGEVTWIASTTLLPYDTNYSAPTVTVLDGEKALVFGSGDGHIWALQPRTGQPIWKYEFSRRGINTPPLVHGNTVYAGHSEENDVGTAMGGVVSLKGDSHGAIGEAGTNWRQFEVMLGKTAPLLIGEQLFCFEDTAKLQVLNAKTGELLARKPLGTVMRSSPIYADGKIYCFEQTGRWYIFRPTEEGDVETVSRGRLPRGEACDASPIVSHGRLYVTTSGGIYCLVDPAREAGWQDPPAAATETPVDADPEPAHVQIVPAEVLLTTGDTQAFRVRLYNRHGQFLREAETAEFKLDGPGTLNADGSYAAPTDGGQAAATVTATVGEMQGQARIRIVPPLPWKFDFEDLNDAPITWVGARYRHVLRDIDGNKVLVKITTIPKGTRSRCWFGQPTLSDYTIQADVRGAIQDDKMPDIGLIAQGYTLDLQGASQQLQIRTWVPQLRMARTIDFPWKPDTWYTMKLRATVENGEAVLRGKVWPKSEPEPEAWTIEATDTSPNTQGSPGLYGNAKDAEIHLDNIEVTAND